MESQEATAVRSDTSGIRVLTSDSSKVRLSKVYRVKGVTRSIVVDALKVMDDMSMECQNSPPLAENYNLLRHYLDYLKRFCEGRV
jgi:hypothetical protein